MDTGYYNIICSSPTFVLSGCGSLLPNPIRLLLLFLVVVVAATIIIALFSLLQSLPLFGDELLSCYYTLLLQLGVCLLMRHTATVLLEIVIALDPCLFDLLLRCELVFLLLEKELLMMMGEGEIVWSCGCGVGVTIDYILGVGVVMVVIVVVVSRMVMAAHGLLQP